MRILITGATAPQASEKTAQRIPTFASMLAKELSAEGGHEVDFLEPSFSFEKTFLSEYDIVLVGVAPPTSLSANKVYPAFAIANRAKELGNLALFIDAPEPFKIPASLKSCYLNISDLQKDFYSRRKEYKTFTSNPELAKEVYDFIEFLYRRPWPVTLYPALPWSEAGAITSAIPNISEKRLYGINLDHQTFNNTSLPSLDGLDSNYWVADQPSTKWTKSIALTLNNRVSPIRQSKWDSAEAIEQNILGSTGTLISVYRSSEPWWTPFVAKSVALGTPVVTDWRYSSVVDGTWGFLASTIEEMSPKQREGLALQQAETYRNSITPARKKLEEAIDMAVSQVRFTYR